MSSCDFGGHRRHLMNDCLVYRCFGIGGRGCCRVAGAQATVAS